MNIFENVKAQVSVKEVARDYGIRMNRHGRGICPFHDDRDPSMLVEDDHYHCFACGAHGDVIDLVSGLTGLRPYDAAKQLAMQYGLQEGIPPSPEIQLKKVKQIEAQQFRKIEQLCFFALAEYRQLLADWKIRYIPHETEEEWDERFVEACHKLDQVEYQMDLLLMGTDNEKKELMDTLFQNGTLDAVQERLEQMKKEEYYGE